MRKIVVTKFGNEPDLFGNSLRHGMLGEWECLKLLKVLSDDINNQVVYFGKAIWNADTANKYFTNKVSYTQPKTADGTFEQSTDIDEFHIVLGPHSFYNGGKNIPAWESIKETLVTSRILERVAPQIKLMNLNPKAKLFFYLSDRRFALQAMDLENYPKEIYAQSLNEDYYETPKFFVNNYLGKSIKKVTIEPFRFETLWLFEKDYVTYLKNSTKTYTTGSLIIPANQVTSDDEICNSRLKQIKDFTEYLADYPITICGKWTSNEIKQFAQNKNAWSSNFNGLEQKEYEEQLLSHRYALILFNTKDCPGIFDDNWLTVKYWECVYNGCLTFVECNDEYIDFIPQELQVKNGKMLLDKIQWCDSSSTYKNKLMKLQDNLVLPEYFSGAYYNQWIKEKRGG